MKAYTAIIVVQCCITACQTEVINNERLGPARFTDEDSACVQEQKRIVETLGFGVSGSVEELITFLLAGKDDKKLPLCTKSGA